MEDFGFRGTEGYEVKIIGGLLEKYEWVELILKEKNWVFKNLIVLKDWY